MKKNILSYISIILLATMLTGCGIDFSSNSVSQQNYSSLSKSQATEPRSSGLIQDNFSISETQIAEAELPPIIFMKYVSYSGVSDEDSPDGFVSFFTKDGAHYISNDGTLSKMYPNIVAEEFVKGTLKNCTELHLQCRTDEIKQEYLKVNDIISSGDFHIIVLNKGPDVQYNTTMWYGIYYDDNGELQYRLIRQMDAMGEHISDNNDLNEVYSWLLEHEKQVFSDIE